MSEKQRSDRGEARDPANRGPCAEKMADMISRCAQMMPDMMARCGGTQDDKDDKEAGCCPDGGGTGRDQ